MDYYAYEYSVLQQLNDELNIKSISVNSEKWDANKTVRNKYGQLENVIVASINMGRTIRLDFVKDFHFEFDSKVLKDAYERKYDTELMVRQLRRDIVDSFVKEFILRKEKK